MKQHASKAWSSSSSGVANGVSSSSNALAAVKDSSSSSKHSDDGSSSSGSNKACCGRKKGARKGDACDVLLARLQLLQQQLVDAHRQAQEDPLPAAFVTFR
jgi:hypothetical protein